MDEKKRKKEIGIAKTFFLATQSKVGQHNNAKVINQVMKLILDYDTNKAKHPFFPLNTKLYRL